MRRAHDALVQGDLPRAEQALRELLKTNPNDTEAQANLGSVLYLQQNWQAAAEQLSAAVAKQPDLWKAQVLLALCKRRTGEKREAQRLLETALPHLQKSPFKTNASIELLESLYEAGDLDKAQTVLQQTELEDPRNLDVLYIAYRIHTDLANAARDRLRLAGPESGRMHELTAQHLVNRGDLGGAIEEYRAALKADPHLRGIHYEMGEAIAQQSPSPEAQRNAEQEFHEALKENPGDANAAAQLGLIALAQSDATKALANFKRALVLEPDNAIALLGMGKTLAQMEKPSEALTYLQKATAVSPENANAHYQLATTYRKLERKGEADREFEIFRKLQQSARPTAAR